ncbi:hypothetical protein ACFLTB_03365 [Chloroflexota bacterium]
MKNSEIAEVLRDIAYLLKCRKENHFKVRAYELVAKTIEEIDIDVEQLVKEGSLREIPGIGEAIEKKITELVTTGHLEYYEKLKAESPEVVNGQSR